MQLAADTEAGRGVWVGGAYLSCVPSRYYCSWTAGGRGVGNSWVSLRN